MEHRHKKKRRTNEQLFLDKLKTLSHGGQKRIGNGTVQKALRWGDERYHKVRSKLLQQRKIIKGVGRGGLVGLPNVPEAKAKLPTLFISYSHLDEKSTADLVKHLKHLKRFNIIDTWYDGKIGPGEEWSKAISANLESADIILLLVSIDYLNSEFCVGDELERALERHEAGTARVIPIILRSCMWQDMPFAKLQVFPAPDATLDLAGDRDKAFSDVAKKIREVVEENKKRLTAV